MSNSATPAYFPANQIVYSGLTEEEQKLVVMCGVSDFETSRIFCIGARPVMIDPEAVSKYNLKNNRDFEGLIGKEAYIIRRKRNDNGEPITDDYTAHKITILSFNYTFRFDTCYIECSTNVENGPSKTENINLCRLFYYP